VHKVPFAPPPPSSPHLLSNFIFFPLLRRAKKFSRKPALKALDYALDDKNNCLRFVEALGLKTLFAAFMKKDVKKARKGFSEEEDDGKYLFQSNI